MHTKSVEPGGDEVTGRRLLMWNADVEISLCRPTEQMEYFFRNGEGDEVIFVHEGIGDARDDLRRAPVQGRRLRRHSARDDLPLPAGRGAAVSGLRNSRPDRDPAPLPQPVRPDHRGRAVLPPGHPPAHGAEHTPRARRVPDQGARPRRVPDLPARLPPVRRRRLGRLSLPVDVLDPRFRADHRPDPPAAAVAPDLRRAATS